MHQYDRDVVLADIPGIIEGASDGAGLGLRFLRHIARTLGLAFVIDAVDEDPVATLATLRGELGSYDDALLHKEAIVIVSRMDLLEAGTTAPLTAAEAGCPVIPVSAMASQGLDPLRAALVKLADRPEES
jgi:GTP-binding protein